MGFMVKLLLILVVGAAAGWAWISTHPIEKSPLQEAAAQNIRPIENAQRAQPNVISTEVVTDTSLSADLKSFDAQAESAASDQASVESSFNDQPVQQTE